MSYDTEEKLSAALHDIAGNRPFAPDLDRIEDRGRKMRRSRLAWRTTAGTGFAAAAIAAVAVATTGSGTPAPAPQLAAPKPTVTIPIEQPPLVQLVGHLTAAPKPAGDATLLKRDQAYANGLRVIAWDLHADNGDYYYAKKRDALPAQVKTNHQQSDEEGRVKAVAAAKFAANGDLNEARKRMALAYLPKNPEVKPTLEAPGVVPPGPVSSKLPKGMQDLAKVNHTDNWVWNNSMDALRDGAGDPLVRAGVLRLLGQMPEIAVRKSTVGAQPVLVLTAGLPATVGGDESLTVNGDTGLPIKYASDGVEVNFTVTRVTIADVAKGKF
jgi:hypothetical protein